ncbi:uncharacterized protein METZ01_LOCUS327877, partial [marine metagenome]
VGAIGCLVMIGLDSLLIWWQFDAVGAIPVHLGAGIWGALAVSLFGDLNCMGITVGVGQHLLVQITAVLTCGAWAFGLTYLVFLAISWHFPGNLAKHLRMPISTRCLIWTTMGRLGLGISSHLSHTLG